MPRSDVGRCAFTASGRHFWLEVEEQREHGARVRYRCRSCGLIAAELARPIDADHSRRAPEGEPK